MRNPLVRFSLSLFATPARSLARVSSATLATLAPRPAAIENCGDSALNSLKSATIGNGLSLANDRGSDGRLASRRLYETATSTSRSHLAYRYDGSVSVATSYDGEQGSFRRGDRLVHDQRMNIAVARGGRAAAGKRRRVSAFGRTAGVSGFDEVACSVIILHMAHG